jgi:nucleoside-diphosphate-sugar epimerase
MRAFVTGATGFVGSALVARLAAMGWEVVALVRPGSAYSHLIERDIELIYGDLNASDSLAAPLAKCDVVFHCAALTGVGHAMQDFHQTIVSGTESLLKASIASGVSRFVFVSSVAAYELGESRTRCDEAQALLSSSIDPYGSAKVEAERICMAAHDRGEISSRIVRPVFVYGPGDRPGGFLPEVAALIQSGKFRLMDGGDHPISLVYISDLIDLLVLVAESDQAHGQIYNANSVDTPTWRQFVDRICNTCQLQRPKSVNSRLVFGLARLLEIMAKVGMIRSLPLSKAAVSLLSSSVEFPSNKAREQLGYWSKVGFIEGMDKAMSPLQEMFDRPA